MSLSGALSNAISGLNVASRSAQTVSNNLANVMTEGYGRREVELGARYAVGIGGVELIGVVRQENPVLTSEMRMSNAELAYSDTISEAHRRLEQLVGTPASASSLTSRVADLEASLVAAAGRPDLPVRLDAVIQDANALSQNLRNTSGGIQEMRRQADSSINKAVLNLNEQLEQVAELNTSISRSKSRGLDASGLKDQRQVLIDQVAGWIPLKEVARGNGQVALYTLGGAQLLDGSAAELSFANAHTIVPHMTIESGLLSGLSINGIEVSTDPESGPFRGGKLAALFEVRDEVTVTAQAELDAVARNLVERFQDPTIDVTRGAGAPGLLTDSGALFDPADEVGIAGRVTVNALVDEAQGGASWRLRDGMGAIVQGATGNASLLQDYYNAIGAGRSIVSGNLSGSSCSAAQLGASLLSEIGAARLTREQQLTFAQARASEIKTIVLSEGVDTDQEMQKLMMIEQAYAANAQMLRTVDEMMDTLMGAI